MAAVLVEIWSDVVCPWCFIGKRKFEAALARFDGRDDVEVVYRAYQLDPTAPPGDARPVPEVYAAKFGGAERAAEMIDRVTTIAAEVGLDFRMERALRANTLDAHRLLWSTEGTPVQAALKERLMQAYFHDGRHLADVDTLCELAAEVGLDPEATRALLASDTGLAEVREQLALAASFGISAVPTYVIDRKWSVPGAQDPDTFLRILERAASAES